MTQTELNAPVGTSASIEAIADCIRAAGFDALAEQYVNEPGERAAILHSAWLRSVLLRALGPEDAARFYALAGRENEHA